MQYVRIFGRSIRDAFKGVFRNLSLSMASILCTTITLIVVAISIVLTYNINNFTKLIESDMSKLSDKIKMEKTEKIILL